MAEVSILPGILLTFLVKFYLCKLFSNRALADPPNITLL